MVRTYESTHPWLKFSVDLKPASPELWMMLGECQSKCEHLSRVPLRPDVSNELHQMYMAKGALATTAIEGNTLSEEEVRKILDGELKLPPSREYLEQEINNVIGEFNAILAAVAAGVPPSINTSRILEMNSNVLAGLSLEEGAVAGRIRQRSVGVLVYRGAPFEDCEYLLEDLCKWLNDITQFGMPTAPRAKVFAILKAILAHLYLAWIHPFDDGNGRTARLLEFQILISSGIPAPAAQLLSNHYHLTRTEYYRQLANASRSGGDVLPFIQYAVQGFLDGLRKQLDVVRQQVFDNVWHNFVVDAFPDKTSPTDTRRMDLLQEISRLHEPASILELPLMSPLIAKHYSSLTPKTLTRDVKKLLKMRFLVQEKGKVRARKEQIQAFLPAMAVIASESKVRTIPASAPSRPSLRSELVSSRTDF